MKQSTLPIDYDKLKQAALLVRAISHPLRLQLLEYIDKKKSTEVFAIWTELHLGQSICSQQLKILRDSELVNVERNGKEKVYTVNYDRISALNLVLSDFFTEKQ